MPRSTERSSSSAPVPAGLLDNRYRLTALLGRGGMGVVYRGVDTRLDRVVAVKVLGQADDADEERFMAEVKILAGFNHPNLVRLLDAGDLNGRPYLVMDLVEGPTLAQRLRSGALTLRESARIGAGVANALAYVHDNGVVHRDVKPANVLLDGQGGAHLSDFGIARLIDTTGMTATGLTLGTPAYLAPEQVHGVGVGAAADVYALGLVLFECATGRRAFGGTVSELTAARLSREVTFPDDLDDGWVDVLKAMTYRDPIARISASTAVVALSGLSESTDVRPRGVAGQSIPDTTVVLAPQGLEDTQREAEDGSTRLWAPLVASEPKEDTRRRARHGRGFALVLGSALVGAAVVIALAAAGVFSRAPLERAALGTTTTLARAAANSSAVSSSTTSSAPTTTIAVVTTLPAASVSSAAATLQSTLQAAAGDGSVDAPTAQQLGVLLQPLLSGVGPTSTSQLDQFAQLNQAFQQAVSDGAIVPGPDLEALDNSIASLATALGTTAASVGTTTTTIPLPPDGHGHGHGRGH